MIAIPRDGEADFDRTDRAVFRTVEDIKDYLDLDMMVTQSAWLTSVKDLLRDAQEA